MTKSANPVNREITDYLLRALREVPDGETIDMVEADNNLEPMIMYGGRCSGLANGLMEIEIVTLYVHEGRAMRRTYQMLHEGLRLVREEPED